MKKLSAVELGKLSKLEAMQHLLNWSSSELSALLWSLSVPPTGRGTKGSYIDQVLTVTHPVTSSPPVVSIDAEQARMMF